MHILNIVFDIDKHKFVILVDMDIFEPIKVF